MIRPTYNKTSGTITNLKEFMDICYICDAPLHKFMTTPILELPNGTHEQCCEKCADEKFPGWDEEEED